MSVLIGIKECPVCRLHEKSLLYALNCGNLDKSKLYQTVRLVNCMHCGHVFNDLSYEELDDLKKYYDEEYAPTNVNSIHIQGDRPGSSDNLTACRYKQLVSYLAPHIHSHNKILDVGCAMGGLLDYLRTKGFSRLTGCDMSQTYVEQAKLKEHYEIELGNAEDLPFEDKTFDVIIMEQVLEHLAAPARAFTEAKRVLKPGGIFCIGVPDAARYADFYFFDFYWLLLREHIQHFDIEHLKLLAFQQGFKMLSYCQTSHAVMSDKMVMPNLCAVFQSTDIKQDNNSSYNCDPFALQQKMADYISVENSKQLLRIGEIAELALSGRPVYIWGMGREFLYLYETSGLKHCNIAGFIDMNPLKIKTASINMIKVNKADILLESTQDSVLLITAIAHTDSIIQTAKSIGFKGEIIALN